MGKYAIGCDLGGTNLRVGVVNMQDGSVAHLQSVPTQARDGYKSVIERMVVLFKQVMSKCEFDTADICGVGIGAPAVLDPAAGIVKLMPNLFGGWRGVPLGKLVSKNIGLPVHLINDVRATTFGEWKYGAGKGARTVICFAVGTGVGGGVVVNNELVMNFNGTTGELGHTIINPDGPACGCGNHGCLEAYASGPALAAMGIKAVKQGRTTIIGELVNYDLNLISPEVIAQAALEGDEIAMDIFQYVGNIIGIAAANAALVVGPERIIISGGVASAGDLLLEPIRKTLQDRIFVMPKESIQVIRAKLGDQAGIIGAANWAFSNSNSKTE
jgi:glucokinase